MRILVIYNSRAAHGRSGAKVDRVRSRFARHGIETVLRLTEHRGHAVEMTRGADLSGFDGVVAAGGDGTLFEVVNGFFLNRSDTRPPLGVVPVGTGNAFARDLDLASGDLDVAVDLIAGGHHRAVDVGRFVTGGEVYHFLNILGFGFVSDVGERAHRLKRLGNFSYTVAVVIQMIALSSYGLTIEIDGEVMERENIFCEISNTRYTSNFLMAPSASVEDGLLDVTLLGHASRTRLLRCFPKIFTGEHVDLPEVETFKAKVIRVRTDDPRVLTPDGEIMGSTPLSVECLPGAIEVFAPERVGTTGNDQRPPEM